MKISAINNGQMFRANEQQNLPKDRKPVRINPFTTTAWTAAGAIGVSMVSGMMHKQVIHKISALVGVIAAAAHIGMAIAHHHHMKNNKA